MDERKEEDSGQDFDENGFDPTKEAFFSDLIDMEEEVATEAYELVEHALHLIENKYFDDCIEVLRQAIGLYTQINRSDEIKAINEKISEVYLLKEQAFRESESKPEKDIVEVEEGEISEEIKDSDIKPESIQEEIEIDLFVRPKVLIEDGNSLLEMNKFEEALDKYDRAVSIFEEANNSEGVDRVFQLIEECYNKKAEFLRSVKKVSPSIEVEREQKQEELIGDELKEKNLQQYLSTKKKEEEISSKAYDILGQAAELAKNKQYDESLRLYEEGAKLFKDLNWIYELKKIQDTIIQLENERLAFLNIFEERKKAKDEESHAQIDPVETIEQEAKDRVEEEKLEKLERLRGIELQRMENEFFKAQIDNMVSEASRMARDYEMGMQRAIKKGEIIKECIYPKVIEIFNKIKELLIDKGWSSAATIYDDTIEVYNQKLEKDRKIRHIEAEKVRKQKESEDFLKVKEVEKIDVQTEPQLQVSEERRRREIEVQKFRAEIDEITKRAERKARDYEIALRKGKFEIKCPYPEIINSYKTALQRSREIGLETDVAIFSSQIQVFTDKLEKDKRLRKIEAEKVLKQKDIDDMLKIQKEDEISDLGDEKLSIPDLKSSEEEVKEDLEQLINDMVNKAELIAREYDLAMKKAVRQGKLIDNPPFAEVIKIYERAKQMLLSKEKQADVSAYNNQINFYSHKWEKDKKLREIESQKAIKQKEIEEIYKADSKIGIDKEKLRVVDRKREEKEFEGYVSDAINKAEKLVRGHETAMRKAMRKGEIIEDTPYSEVINIYKEIREKVYARGWKEQAEVYANQIKIYEGKLEKHVNLLEVEAKKADKQKQIEEMHKVGKDDTEGIEKLRSLEQTKEEGKEFERFITDNINNAEKLVRDHETAMRKAMRKGEIIEDTPYSEVINIYKDIREKVYARGWKEQAEVYANQIKIYQERLEKHVKLLEIEAKKAGRQKDIEEMYKIKEDSKPVKPDKRREIEKEINEDDILLDSAMNLIDEAERLVKNYELSIKTDVLLYESPYDKAISNYQEAKKMFQKIGWNDEASRLMNTLKFYQEKKEKDEKLRLLEKKKLEEPATELGFAKDDTDKDLLARELMVLELEKAEKKKDETVEKIFTDIHKAERIAKEYEIKIKEGIFDQEPPYEEIFEIYREARKRFEEIGWMEESMKLINTIKFYKEKQGKDKKLRALEITKVNKRDEELARQQRLLKQAKEEQERLLKQRKESLLQKEEKVIKFESAKNKAFELMDKAKNELNLKNFDKTIEHYKESEEIFSEISWQEGINMVKDSIAMIKRRKKSFELEQTTIERERLEKLKIEEKLEKRYIKAGELRKLQQEEKRKEFLKVQSEKQWEREISEEAYKLLEKGTSLLERSKFEGAYENYIEARKLFDKISWKREVSRINNELLFKLKRERKTHDILEDIKKKKVEEEDQMKKLKKETERERRELKKQKKEDKRKLAREEFDKEIFRELERAEKHIDDFKYNEGILLLIREKKKLEKSAKDDEVKKIDEVINSVKDKVEIPLVTLEPLGEIENLEKFEATYKALDKAQISLENNRLMKAVSELKEAKFNLKTLKIGKRYIKEIEIKIKDLQERLGRKPSKEDVEEKEHEAEMDVLKARIEARREERRKKVLNLLKKD